MLYEAVRAVADRDPTATAVRCVDGPAVSYRELCEMVERTAAGLRRAGVGPGATVACSLGNSIGYVALILAVAHRGAAYVPLIREFSVEQVRAALDLTRPTIVVVDGTRPEPPATVPLVALNDLMSAGAAEGSADPPGRTWGRFRYLWTSGSTGLPKMMAWRQDRFLPERLRWVRHIGVTAADVVHCRHTLDVAHATDLHVFTALLAGAELVLGDPLAGPRRQLDDLAGSGATVTSALPRHYEQLVDAARAGAVPSLARLRLPFCGGTYVSPRVIADADAVLGIRIRQLYGSTEFGLAAVNLADVVQTDAAMPLVPGVGARLAPLMAADERVGELVLRSAYTSDGYLNNDEAHARTFREGEYWTGDVAQRLPGGEYRVLGRVSEALAATGGVLLAPMLDDELARIDAVAEAVCLRPAPERVDNEVVVVARRAVGHPPDEVRRTVHAALDRHGLTGPVHVVDELPYTAVGKPHKAELRERWISRTGGPMSRHAADPAPLIPHRRHGRAPALVFVPGLATTAAYFDGIASELGGDHDVVTVDLRGHGGAAVPQPGWTIDDAARDVRAVIEKLELNEATLVGWSLGAGVAYTYLELFGTDRVSRLVSVEMSPRLLGDEQWPHAAFGGLDAPSVIAAQRDIWADPERFVSNLVRQCFASHRRPEPALVAELTQASRGVSPVAVLALWVDVLTRDWRSTLSTLTLPTLLIHGAHSQIYPTDVGAWLAKQMPNARLEMFDHSGHAPFLEEPERFAAVLRAFVKESRDG